MTPRDRTVKESEGASALDGDVDMLQRLLASLTINALQAMPTGGRLIKTARASNGAVELGVHDTGPGIKGDSDTIFEPFRTTKVQEVGLSLTVAKRIAEATRWTHRRGQHRRQWRSVYRAAADKLCATSQKGGIYSWHTRAS